MRFPRSIQSPLALPIAVVLLAAAALPVAAQGRELFTWSGNIDREIRISMRGRTAWSNGAPIFGEERGRTRIAGALPRSAGHVEVRIEDGRGVVDVLQQPSARNDYTTVVRVSDRSGGADRYRVRAWWWPEGNRPGTAQGRIYENGRIGDYDRDPRYDRDPWYDRPGRGRGNDRAALLWSGYVDDVLEIRLRGQRIEYRTLSGRTVRAVRVEVPRRRVVGRVNLLAIGWRHGRGSIRVVQQPSPRNGNTTIIHIRDPQSGYGRYAFEMVPGYFRR